MAKTIQMIYINDKNSLFIIDFKDNILSFRTNYNPNYLQKEKIKIQNDNIYVSFYNFHINYLNKFVKENNINII